MPKGNSQKRSTPDMYATIKWGLNGEEQMTLLKVRTGPECPEGNLRVLM